VASCCSVLMAMIRVAGKALGRAGRCAHHPRRAHMQGCVADVFEQVGKSRNLLRKARAGFGGLDARAHAGAARHDSVLAEDADRFAHRVAACAILPAKHNLWRQQRAHRECAAPDLIEQCLIDAAVARCGDWRIAFEPMIAPRVVARGHVVCVWFLRVPFHVPNPCGPGALPTAVGRAQPSIDKISVPGKYPVMSVHYMSRHLRATTLIRRNR